MSRNLTLYPGAGLRSWAYAPLLHRLARAGIAGRVQERSAGSRLADNVRGAAALAARVGPLIVVGHSMGAFAAEALARAQPGAVAGLVLLDASVAAGGSAPRGQGDSEASSPGPPAEAQPGPWPVRGRIGRLPGARLRVDLARYPRDAATLQELRGRAPLPDVPVLVVSAAWTRRAPWDRRWLRAQSELVAALREDHPRSPAGVAQVVLLPCGHAVMWWRIGATANAIRALADAVSGPRSG